jgi:hypothetical protein
MRRGCSCEVDARGWWPVVQDTTGRSRICSRVPRHHRQTPSGRPFRQRRRRDVGQRSLRCRRPRKHQHGRRQTRSDQTWRSENEGHHGCPWATLLRRCKTPPPPAAACIPGGQGMLPSRAPVGHRRPRRWLSRARSCSCRFGPCARSALVRMAIIHPDHRHPNKNNSSSSIISISAPNQFSRTTHARSSHYRRLLRLLGLNPNHIHHHPRPRPRPRPNRCSPRTTAPSSTSSSSPLSSSSASSASRLGLPCRWRGCCFGCFGYI